MRAIFQVFIICITLLLLVNCAPVYPFYSHNHDDYYDEPFHDDPDPDDHLVPGSLSHSHYGTYTFQLPEDNDRPPADILFTTTQSPPLPQSPPSLPLTPLSPDNRVFVLKTPELPQTLVENKSQQPQPQQQLPEPPLPKPDNYSSVVNVSFDYFDNETEGQVELEDQYGEYEAEREADEDTAEDDDNRADQVPEFEDEVEDEEEEEEEDGSGFSEQKQTDDTMWQAEEENNLTESDDGFLNDSISENDENDLEESENAEDEMIQVQNSTTGSQLSSFQPQKENSSAPVEQMKEAITNGELFENENDEDDEKYENEEDYESKEIENDREENEKYKNDENEDEDYDEIENGNDDDDDDDEELESNYKIEKETEYDILNDFDVFSEPIQLILNLSKSIQSLDQPLQQVQNLSVDIDKFSKPFQQQLNLTGLSGPVQSNQLQHNISALKETFSNNSQTQHLNSTNANKLLTPTYQQNSTEQVNLTALLDKNTIPQHLNQNSSLPFIELSEPKLLQNLSLSNGANLTSATTVPFQYQSSSPVIEPTFNITTTHTPQNQTNEEITSSVESPLPMPQLQNGSTVDISLPDQVQQQQQQLLLNTSTVVTDDLWNTTLKLSSGNLSITANESLPQAIQEVDQQPFLNLTTVSNENQAENSAQQIYQQNASSLLSSSSNIDSKQQQGQMENETTATTTTTTVTKLPSIFSEPQIENSSELFISTTTSNTTSTPLPIELIKNSNGQNLTVNLTKEDFPLLPMLQQKPISQTVKNVEFEAPKKKQQIQYLPAIVVTSIPMVITKYAKQPFLNLSATISDLSDDDDDDAKNDRHHLKRPHLPQIINSRVPCFSQRDCQSVTLFGLKANRCDRVTGTCVGQYFSRPKTLSPKNGALHFQTQIELPISAVAITTTTTTTSTTEIPPTEIVVPTQMPTQSSSSSSDEGPIETSSSSSSSFTSAPAPVTALDSTAAAAKRGIFNFISLLFS